MRTTECSYKNSLIWTQTLCNNYLKMGHESKYRMQNFKISRSKHGRRVIRPGFGDEFLDVTPNTQSMGA